MATVRIALRKPTSHAHVLAQGNLAPARRPPSARPGPSHAPDDGLAPPAPGVVQEQPEVGEEEEVDSVIYAPHDLGREDEVGAAQATTAEVKDDNDVLFKIASRHFLTETVDGVENIDRAETVNRGIQVQSETMDQGAQAQVDLEERGALTK